MKLAIPGIAVVGALCLITTAAGAQTRVSVSVGVAAPPVYGRVVVGAPPYYHGYPAPVIIVERRPHYRRYRRPGLVIVRPVHRQRHYYRHPHRHWRYDDD